TEIPSFYHIHGPMDIKAFTDPYIRKLAIYDNLDHITKRIRAQLPTDSEITGIEWKLDETTL
ncbi:MAG TPA: hypothetical protein VF220_03770, partial [Nitrososphaeraceae archaeon]